MSDMGGRAICQVCPRRCSLKEGQIGFCRARRNYGGKVVCANYGRVTSMALDPIEKKPLKMFYPGGMVLSVGSYGCNLRCPFCQNYEISTGGGDGEWMAITPEELAHRARMLLGAGNIGLAFTYNEPMVGYEFVRDASAECRRMGMKNVLVTNGFFEEQALEEILPFMDAMNIDLKGFTEEWYGRLGGGLKTVKRFIAEAAASCHVELTTLIVQGENDSVGEMERLSAWVASVDEDIPLHVTRFFPRWRMADRPPTDVSAVYRLAETARRKLRHVFVGNL